MKKVRLKKGCLFLLFFLVIPVVHAKPQVWTRVDGTTFEAEYMNLSSSKVIFKDAHDKVLKVPFNNLSPECQIWVELENPPELGFDCIKKSDTKVFPAGAHPQTQRPTEEWCHYGIRIKQTSMGYYNHKLDVELFIIGCERLGDKFILLDRQKTSFFLTRDNKREFEFRSKYEVVFRNFYIAGIVRGMKYFGYLVVVKDLRGETIAMEASHDWLPENIDNLKERYVNNFMDKTCTRVFPTRPPVFVDY